VKVLVVRFSSIGDIVLTSPVIRCIKQQLPDVELHYLTKKSFQSIVVNNPYVDKTITIEKSIKEILPLLKAENYDFLVDLHNNIRTLSLKRKLHVRSAAFPKLHVAKWLMVNFKVNVLPDKHIIERYFEAVRPLEVVNDGQRCDFFIAPDPEVDTEATLGVSPKQFVAFAIGAQFATKRLPVHKMVEIIKKIDQPVVLLGGPTDQETALQILEKTTVNVINSCGKFTLRESASVVRQSAVLLTHDTGLMHIASAFGIPTVSVWGNTVPDFGMYPYFPGEAANFSMHGVTGLPCRPCSKIGFQACPKKHFKCMELQDTEAIAADVNQRAISI